jgi:cytoskeletal protein CcmA (bactofilin family)
MNHTFKVVAVVALASLLALVAAEPGLAFDGRSGDDVIIASDEVIDDDLYVTAQQFALEGTINGDVVVFAETATINGTINGNLLAAGQTVIVNGTVTGSIRAAGAVILIGEDASVGGDVVGAGYSLETRGGSQFGRDVVFAGGQTLLAGDIARNIMAATGALEIRGNVGGDVDAQVGEAGEAGPPPGMFMPQSAVAVPSVRPGLTIDPSASIGGDLTYTQSKELSFPASVVAGKISRTVPPATTAAPHEKTTGQKLAAWGLNSVRNAISLILIGLLLIWLFPTFVRGLSERLQAKPWNSLGWGVVSWAGFFFAVFLVIIVTILAGVLFGILTLGQLAGAAICLGFLALIALIAAFALVTAFLAKIVFGTALGKGILLRTNSPLAEHRYWPMVIGVLITVAILAVLSFPLFPGALGWLFNLAIVLFGLGALWLWGRDKMTKKPAA